VSAPVLRLGISTCPNDTFLFHGLLSGEVEVEGHRLEIELLDVQELNQRLLDPGPAPAFDVAKASYHLALRMADELLALPTGSALGFGNGPLLLARAGLEPPTPTPSSRVLCPGEHTTAALLYRLFFPEAAAAEHVIFSEVMPALEQGRADLGVCIHEGRFTYAESGLGLVEDLGARWESDTGAPLPLGGIFARRSLPQDTVEAVQDALRRSLALARANPEAALHSMRQYAQEFSDEVLWSHVDLYVNDWTRDLGAQGRRAIETLAERAAHTGLVAPGTRLEVYEPLGERRLFHLVPNADAESLATEGHLPVPSLDSEGFIHLSFSDQLAGTLQAHFDGVQRVALLELDRDSLAGAVRFETSRGGARFPHLFRPLDLDQDVSARWTLEREGESFRVPEASQGRRASGPRDGS
jgi:1,4-dihydroxy-6-naphthoate synthase